MHVKFHQKLDEVLEQQRQRGVFVVPGTILFNKATRKYKFPHGLQGTNGLESRIQVTAVSQILKRSKHQREMTPKVNKIQIQNTKSEAKTPKVDFRQNRTPKVDFSL